MKYNAAHRTASEYRANLIAITQFLPTVLAAALMSCAGIVLANQDAGDVGSFVALLTTTQAFAMTLTNIVAKVTEVYEGFDAVKQCAELLNADTRRRQMLHQRPIKMKRIMDSEIETGPINRENIIVQDLEYKYGDSAPVFSEVSFNIKPGTIVCLRSKGPAGKSTMLKLLAEILSPTKGFVSYPTDWRIRFLNDAELFDLSLMQNLRFGNNYNHSDSEIWNLCKKLGLSQQLRGKGNFLVGRSGANLAMSDRIIVTLARAILSNVDLLLINNLLDFLPEKSWRKVFIVLKELIQHRGLKCLSGEYNRINPDMRKPKTIVISTRRVEIEDSCDMLIDLETFSRSTPKLQEERALPNSVSGISQTNTPTAKDGEVPVLERCLLHREESHGSTISMTPPSLTQINSELVEELAKAWNRNCHLQEEIERQKQELDEWYWHYARTRLLHQTLELPPRGAADQIRADSTNSNLTRADLMAKVRKESMTAVVSATGGGPEKESFCNMHCSLKSNRTQCRRKRPPQLQMTCSNERFIQSCSRELCSPLETMQALSPKTMTAITAGPAAAAAAAKEDTPSTATPPMASEAQSMEAAATTAAIAAAAEEAAAATAATVGTLPTEEGMLAQIERGNFSALSTSADSKSSLAKAGLEQAASVAQGAICIEIISRGTPITPE
jgi:ABC-type multidrug transport system ATPase subunit